MTKTNLIILIFCIGFPIIIVSAIMIFKGLKENRPLLPLLSSFLALCFLVTFLYSIELNIDFADGTWKLSVDERTSELVKAQFSKDGKCVLVSGMKEGNSIINISREDETYGGSILVRVEEPEEWYEKLQEEIKLYSRENK